jgi:hypothetical protein
MKDQEILVAKYALELILHKTHHAADSNALLKSMKG